jgi:hypothetical protein
MLPRPRVRAPGAGKRWRAAGPQGVQASARVSRTPRQPRAPPPLPHACGLRAPLPHACGLRAPRAQRSGGGIAAVVAAQHLHAVAWAQGALVRAPAHLCRGRATAACMHTHARRMLLRWRHPTRAHASWPLQLCVCLCVCVCVCVCVCDATARSPAVAAARAVCVCGGGG